MVGDADRARRQPKQGSETAPKRGGPTGDRWRWKKMTLPVVLWVWVFCVFGMRGWGRLPQKVNERVQ